MATAKTTTEEVKNPTYFQLISQDEKTIKSEQLKIDAQKASIAVQTEIMKLNQQLAIATNDLNRVKRAIPYSITAEYKATEEIEILEERLDFAKDIMDSRFSDVTI
jgi:septal ring factor EnvC (AmiA/AmiB activator)